MTTPLEQPPHRPWWVSTLAVVAAAFAGTLAGWTGIRGEIDRHERTLQQIEIRLHHLDSQADRVERKLDKILDRGGDK